MSLPITKSTTTTTNKNQAGKVNAANFNFNEAKPIVVSTSSSESRRGGKNIPSLNICYANKNRKSLKISKALFESLGNPDSIQFIENGNLLVLGEKMPNDAKIYSYKFSNPTSMVIYNAGLVAGLVQTFHLDFSNGRTSRSFQNIEIVHPKEGSAEKPYAIIDMSIPV